MKTNTTLNIFALACTLAPFAAQATGKYELPICDDSNHSPAACYLKAEDASDLLPNMMIENAKALKKLNHQAKYGFRYEFGTVSEEIIDTHEHHHYKSIRTYNLVMLDTGGGDVVGGVSIWTVVETEESDGYQSSSTFVNTLSTIDPHRNADGVNSGVDNDGSTYATVENLKRHILETKSL